MFASVREAASRAGALQIVGFLYFPKGALNSPREFTRKRPLKQVLLRKRSRAARSTHASPYAAWSTVARSRLKRSRTR